MLTEVDPRGVGWLDTTGTFMCVTGHSITYQIFRLLFCSLLPVPLSNRLPPLPQYTCSPPLLLPYHTEIHTLTSSNFRSSLDTFSCLCFLRKLHGACAVAN